MKYKSSKEIILALILRYTNRLIGWIGLILNKEHKKAKLGYRIGNSYWKNGYTTKAAKTILRFGFEELKLEGIHAHDFSRNQAFLSQDIQNHSYFFEPI